MSEREVIHSIDRHPIRQFADFAAIANDVQFCRISWPLCVLIVPAHVLEGDGNYNYASSRVDAERFGITTPMGGERG